MLGGSFNPAHDGHRAIAHAFATRLRLDQVWLLVSPGNPLKPRAGMAPLAARLASAAAIADGRRVIATAIEARLGTRYTLDTVRALQRRHPGTRFVWLMGADALAQFPRWRGWMRLARRIPIAVHARPGQDRGALAGQAAWRLARWRLPARAAATLADQPPPAWLFLALPHHAASATALRAAGFGLPGAPALQPDVAGHPATIQARKDP